AALAGMARGRSAGGGGPALPTGRGGLWPFSPGPAHPATAHDIMLWHLGTEVAAVVSFTIVVVIRRRDGLALPGAAARGLGLLAAAVLVVGSYLGGVLPYHEGTGVDPRVLAPEIREGHHHGSG